MRDALLRRHMPRWNSKRLSGAGESRRDSMFSFANEIACRRVRHDDYAYQVPVTASASAAYLK